MHEQQKEHFRKKLEADEARLVAQLRGLERPEATDMGQDVDHFDEETDEAEATVTNLSLRETIRERLENIKATLFKINQDTYGYCEKCGGEIGVDVLNADPESRWCKSCKIK